MKIMPCPLNGPRNISEFTFGGEVTPLPDVASAPDSEWAEHTFYSYNGTGVAKDYAKAAEWFGRAAEKSNAAAQYNLGILYYNGQGVPKDDRLAYKWISAAAENGDQKAIVARDALKKALPADVTKPAAPTFDSGLPANSPAGPGGTPIEISPAK